MCSYRHWTVVAIDSVPLHWSVFMADTSQSYYCEGGPRCMHIHYIKNKVEFHILSKWHLTHTLNIIILYYYDDDDDRGNKR